MKHHPFLPVTGLTAIAMVALAACGSPAPTNPTAPQGSSPEPAQLVFRSFDPPTESGGLAKAVEAWNQSNPNIQVTFETVAVADALAQYTREVNGGSGPDIAQSAFVWVKDLGANGLAENLDPLIAAGAPGNGIDDFLAMEINQSEGSTFGISWTADTFALAYDPATLSEAGASGLPTSWEGLAELATKLTGNGRSGFCFGASSAPASEVWHLFNYHVWGQGASLVTTQNGASTVDVTEEQLKKTVSYLNDFFASGANPAGSISIDTAGDPSIMNALVDGSCAIAFVSPAQFRAAREKNPNLVTGPIPAGANGEITTHQGGRSLVINPNTKNKEAAWEFLTYLTTADFFANYYTGQFAAQKSVLDSVDYGAEFDGFRLALPTARTYSMFISSPSPTAEYQSLTNQMLGSVFSGQMTPEQAVPGFLTGVDALVNA